MCLKRILKRDVVIKEDMTVYGVYHPTARSTTNADVTFVLWCQIRKGLNTGVKFADGTEKHIKIWNFDNGYSEIDYPAGYHRFKNLKKAIDYGIDKDDAYVGFIVMKDIIPAGTVVTTGEQDKHALTLVSPVIEHTDKIVFDSSVNEQLSEEE